MNIKLRASGAPRNIISYASGFILCLFFLPSANAATAGFLTDFGATVGKWKGFVKYPLIYCGAGATAFLYLSFTVLAFSRGTELYSFWRRLAGGIFIIFVAIGIMLKVSGHAEAPTLDELSKPSMEDIEDAGQTETLTLDELLKPAIEETEDARQPAETTDEPSKPSMEEAEDTDQAREATDELLKPSLEEDAGLPAETADDLS